MTLPLWPSEPSRLRGDQSGSGPGHAPRRLSLVRLSGEIARSMAAIGRIAVEGEVHRPQTFPSGRTYFVLRDRAAQVPVACPARHARRCRAVAGERVIVVGTLVWGNERGQLLLEAEEVTPVGEGAVAAMIAETRSRLEADGLLHQPGRPLPRLPRVIGVLCGADAAVRKDIESVVAARFPGYPLAVEETTVTGPGAAQAIVEALWRLCRRPQVDVVVLARGGGDSTALLPWSDEDLCRAVAACPVPVVSAIGHEADRPLCDEVADLRCGTPSIAAHVVVPDQRQLDDELAGLFGVSVAGAGGSLVWPGRGWSTPMSEVLWPLASSGPGAGCGTPASGFAGRTPGPPFKCAGAGSRSTTGAGQWPRVSVRRGSTSKAWPATLVRCRRSTLSREVLPSSGDETGP